MTTSKFNDINEVLLSHDIEIVSSIESDLKCGMCQQLVKEPFVTTCGCTHCRLCIYNYLKSGARNCPGTKPECHDCLLDRDTDIYFDPKTNIRIGKLIGKCPNKLCDVEIRLLEMKQHIQTCLNRKSFCPYFSIGCSDSRITLTTIEDHLRENSVSHAYMMVEHVNNSRNDLESMVAQYEERLRNLGKDMEELRCQLTADKVRFVRNGNVGKQSEIWRHNKISLQNIVVTFVLVIVLSYGVYDRGSDVRHQWRDDIVRVMKDREYGDFVWRVANVSGAVFEAKYGDQTVIESDPFLSHKHGYRLKIQMYPNGVDHHRNVHLSVRLVVVPGPWDDIVTWPFKMPTKLAVVNQETGADINSIFLHSNGYTSSTLRRATEARNDSAADLRYDPAWLKNVPGFVKNDVVYVRCTFKR